MARVGVLSVTGRVVADPCDTCRSMGRVTVELEGGAAVEACDLCGQVSLVVGSSSGAVGGAYGHDR